MTSHDLKWPRILKIPTDLFLAWSQLSKNIVFEKSQKNHFSGPFSSTSSLGWNGPKPKLFLHLTIPHCTSCTSLHLTAPHCTSFYCFSGSVLAKIHSIFKYELRGLKWPETKIHPKGFCLTIPHHPSQSTIHNPQSSILNPQSSILNPQFSVFYDAVLVILYYFQSEASRTKGQWLLSFV